MYDFRYNRKVLNKRGEQKTYEVNDYSYRLWKEEYPDRKTPDYFVNAKNLSPDEHLKMQSVLQKYVDNAISKTINVAEDLSFEEFKNIYQKAYRRKLKGCTTYRPDKITGAILELEEIGESHVHCCTLDREGD